MDVELLKIAAQVAGIGGLSLGVLLLVFRDVVRKRIFPMLKPEQGYRLLRLIIVLVWLVAVVGIGAWVWVTRPPERPPLPSFTGTFYVGEYRSVITVDFDIRKGYTVTVVAEGLVDNGHPFIEDSPPEGGGGRAEPNFPAPQLQKYSLIGSYVGGAWFLIGRSFQQVWTSDSPGRLTLGYNDDKPNDGPHNPSVWTVRVTITPPPQPN
jgi:hypothetical protein